jgi:hypothetical protein
MEDRDPVVEDSEIGVEDRDNDERMDTMVWRIETLLWRITPCCGR